jgi:type I restriction enzyme S subunit
MSNLVPDGWLDTSIAQLTLDNSLFKDGDWVESKDQDPSGNNRLIQLADIGDGRFINKSSRFLNDEQFSRLNCTELEKGDVLVARMPEPLGRACIYPLKSIRAATIVDVAVIRTKNADHYWLMSAINSSIFRRDIDLNASGTTRTRIARGALAKLRLIAPPLPEQQKIAQILTSVDEVIEKTKAQIDKLKDLKTGMMQELLTNGIGHLEFKDSQVGRIPVGWEVVPLFELIHVMESGWSPQCETFPAQVGEWGVLKTTSVKWDGFNYKENKKLPKNLDARIPSQVNAKDILITRAGPADRVGVVAYVDEVPEKIMLSDKIIRLKTKQICSPKFLSIWLSSDTTKNYIASRISGLAQSQTNISQDILKKCPCVLPSMKEQENIADAISSLEQRLQNLVAKHIQQKALKKALMQDLLTGKVRVNAEQSNSPLTVG